MKRILLALFVSGIAAAPLFAGDEDIPRKAPELAFMLPGQGQRLLSQYRGKVIALEFILTTCPHCQAASRVMTGFQQRYGSRGFQALDLAINALEDGRNESQAATLVDIFARQFQVGFPVGWVPKDQFLGFMGFSVMERYMVPQLVFIDRKGFIRFQTPPQGSASAMTESAIQQRIEELLAADNSPKPSGKSRASKKGS